MGVGNCTELDYVCIFFCVCRL